MSDEYKDRYIIIALLKTPPGYYRQYKIHHRDSHTNTETEGTYQIEQRISQIRIVDRLLKLPWILLVRLFQKSIYIWKVHPNSSYYGKYPVAFGQKREIVGVGQSDTANNTLCRYCFQVLGCGSFVRGRKRKKVDSRPLLY